jgi:hypothetical protein
VTTAMTLCRRRPPVVIRHLLDVVAVVARARPRRRGV